MTAVAEAAETELTVAFEQRRRELLVLCYRMTGSFADAEDLTQETFLRAWRGRDGFRQGASLRTWLYRIATNACLDFLAAHERRAAPSQSPAELLECDGKIGPFPDWRLTSAPGPDPAVVVETRETTELLVVAALLRLPPRQRVAIIAREFLELSAADTAAMLGSSVSSANSLVQRARAEVRRHHQTMEPAVPAGPEDDELVRRYVRAHQDGDVGAIIDMLADDVRVSMPPEASCIGRKHAAAFFARVVGPARPGEWRLVAVRANGRPATANFLRRHGDSRSVHCRSTYSTSVTDSSRLFTASSTARPSQPSGFPSRPLGLRLRPGRDGDGPRRHPVQGGGQVQVDYAPGGAPDPYAS